MTTDKTPMQPCGECSMLCDPKEYHPYAACLMFKACHNSETVRANLEAVRGSPVVAVEPQPSAEGPPELWLQLHCDCLPHERLEPVDYTGGDVTWCWHAIHSDDVRYVRADLATTPQPTQPQAGAVTDAQVLAAVRVVSPNLFRHGLQPLPHDGANTAAQMRKEADTVRKMLEAAHGITKGANHD